MYIYKLPLVKQRVYVYQDHQEEILSYGAYNVYPQSMENYMQASGVCSAAVKKFQDFLFGDGLRDEQLSRIVINGKNDDLNDLLEGIAYQYALYDTIALHISYNGLYQVNGIKTLPVNFCRLGDPTTSKKDMVAVWNNWAGESWDQDSTEADIDYLDAFNPNPDAIEEQVRREGGIGNYKGQILYLNKQQTYTYSRATFDSVLDDVISDAAFATYRKKNVKSSFAASGIVLYNTQVESEAEREEIQREVQNLQGDENAGNLLVVTPSPDDKFDEGEDPIKFIPFQPNNIDGLYKNQEASVASRIVGAYNQPRALHTFFDDSGIYNQDLLQNAWKYYNEQTKKDRKYLSRVLSDVFSNWHESIEGADFSIKPQQFGEDSVSEESVIEVENEKEVAPTGTKFSIGDFRKVQNMVDKFETGKVSYEQAMMFLRGYMTEDEAISLLKAKEDGELDN